MLISSDFTGDIAFIDDHKNIDSYHGFPVFHYLPPKNYSLHIAIGDNEIRRDLFNKLLDKDFTNIISTRSYFSRFSKSGRNVFVGNQSHIGPGTSIGNNCIINTGALIEHDVKVGDHSHISVNATVAGNVSLGNEVLIGAGAIIKNNISICDNVVIGAGSVVVSDIYEKGIYAGIPAKKLKN